MLLGKSILDYDADMRRSHLFVMASALYVTLLFAGLLLPRKITAEPAPTGLLKKLLHEIIFLAGPLEVLLNFLLFIPLFLALLCLLPGLSRYASAVISCLTSAVAEIAQSQIVGRVNSLRDFLSNSIGVLIALIAIDTLSKRKAP
jgi:glycopeptide antibiotics resistance protein